MSSILSLSLIVIAIQPPPPPPPPVGDQVPVDGGIWLLFVVALIIGSFYAYRKYKSSLKTH